MARRIMIALLLASALALLPACGEEKAPATKEAVKAAIEDYLQTRPGLSLENMTMEITKVEFRGDTAEAEVLFRSKVGEGQMPFRYTLRREGDRWVVEPHGSGGGGQMPEGHPPTSEPQEQEPPETLPRSSR